MSLITSNALLHWCSLNALLNGASTSMQYFVLMLNGWKYYPKYNCKAVLVLVILGPSTHPLHSALSSDHDANAIEHSTYLINNYFDRLLLWSHLTCTFAVRWQVSFPFCQIATLQIGIICYVTPDHTTPEKVGHFHCPTVKKIWKN